MNMKKCISKFILFVGSIVLLAVSADDLMSQTIIRIGDAEIQVKSPLSISRRDSSEIRLLNGTHSEGKKYPMVYNETFFGLGSVIPQNRNEYLDMHYGKINSLEFGHRYFYRLSRRYSIGTTFQYTYYNYKLDGVADAGLIRDDVPGVVRKEYYRTDNIGTGLINRFYLFPLGKRAPFTLDIGGYADFAFSKRYKVKTTENGKKEKYKYRDGARFNPFNAGLYGALKKGDYSLYVKYRFTNLFNPDIMELQLPELSIGIQCVL